jgi:hypothetical protein
VLKPAIFLKIEMRFLPQAGEDIAASMWTKWSTLCFAMAFVVKCYRFRAVSILNYYARRARKEKPCMSVCPSACYSSQTTAWSLMKLVLLLAAAPDFIVFSLLLLVALTWWKQELASWEQH